MATLDKDVLADRKKKRLLRIVICWCIWLLISFYLAYYIDQLLQMIFDMRMPDFIWSPMGVLKAYQVNGAVKVWYLVLQMFFWGLTIYVLLAPSSELKEINTIQITDEIAIPKAVGNGQYGNARFATKSEFEKMTDTFLFSGKEDLPGRGGLVVEMKKSGQKEIIRYIGENLHSLILGSTGSGKTRRILLETIWLQLISGVSVVVSDVKGEIYYYTKDYAEEKGYKTLPFDLRSPQKSIRYNFLQPILNALERNDSAKAIDYTWDLVSVLVGEPKGEPLWYNGETATIAAAILCVAMEADKRYRNLTNVYYFLAYMCMMNPETGKAPLTFYLQTLPDDHPAKTVFAVAQVSAPRTRSSFYTSALGTLRLFTNPNVAAMTAESDFEIKDIGREKTVLYLMIPDEKKTLYPLASLLIQQLYIAQVEVANENGLMLPVPTDYDLDEVGNFPTIPVLENIASAGRSRGVRMNLVLQDYQQMETKYKDSFETIKTCCQMKVLLKTDNSKTLREIKESLDQYTVEVTSASTSTNTGKRMDANYSNSSNMTGRALLTADEIMRIKYPYALVMKTSEHPIITQLPDLSEYKINEILGLGDEEHNRRIVMEREAQRKARPSTTEVPLWGIWNKYKQILEKDAERRVSFLK